MTDRPRIYLAGPAVFRRDAQTWAERVRAICLEHGLEGVFPADGAVETVENGRRLDGPEIARRIYAANLALIDSCAAVLADLTPFRGPSADIGTAMEIGYAVAREKPVVGYGIVPSRPYRLRVPHQWVPRDRTLPDAGHVPVALADGMLVEDFGLPDNLMVACALAPGVGVVRDLHVAIAALAGMLNGRKAPP